MDEYNQVPDQDEMNVEHVQRLKSSRRGLLSTVTVKKNEIRGLMSDDNNLELVKAKLSGLSQSFINYKEAHKAYLNYVPIVDPSRTEEQQRYEEEEVSYSSFMMHVNAWMAAVELRCDVQIEITLQDSVSQASSRKSGASKHNSSTTSAAKINEAIRMAELSVRAKSLEAQQQLELQKLQLKQQEERLRLETEIARSTAKKEILSTLQSEVSIKSGAKSQSSRDMCDRFSDSQRALPKDPKTL